MSSQTLSNRRNTRENLLMFFYSIEFNDRTFEADNGLVEDFLEGITELKKEDSFESVRDTVKEIFDNVKIIKLEQDDVIEFCIPFSKEPVSMTFGEMDLCNVTDGFLTRSAELMEGLERSGERPSEKNPGAGTADNKKFFRDYVSFYFRNMEVIDGHIRSNLENWDFGRISIIDKIILRMGIVELLNFGDIPPKVVINEAIELGKKYSTEKSNIFINGILNKLKNEIRKNEK